MIALITRRNLATVRVRFTADSLWIQSSRVRTPSLTPVDSLWFHPMRSSTVRAQAYRKPIGLLGLTGAAMSSRIASKTTRN
jgi:hypothetical protein